MGLLKAGADDLAGCAAGADGLGAGAAEGAGAGNAARAGELEREVERGPPFSVSQVHNQAVSVQAQLCPLNRPACQTNK